MLISMWSYAKLCTFNSESLHFYYQNNYFVNLMYKGSSSGIFLFLIVKKEDASKAASAWENSVTRRYITWLRLGVRSVSSNRAQIVG